MLAFAVIVLIGRPPRVAADGPPPNPPDPGPPTLAAPVPSIIEGDDPNSDSDGDGIPNQWEDDHFLDRSNFADAGSDFDNDGLTALQEFMVWSRPDNPDHAYGNPLGKWRADEVPHPDGAGSWVSPVAINNRGEILVQTELWDPYRETAMVLGTDGQWREIVRGDGSEPTRICASDLNDRGEVVGQCYDLQWGATWGATEPFIWDAVAGYRPFTFNGSPAEAVRINNRGDWIGSAYNPATCSWESAYVVGGQKVDHDLDWWPFAWYTDINDFGEALGSFIIGSECRTFLATDAWICDTGYPAIPPEFDDAGLLWTMNAAMNDWGEYVGGINLWAQGQWLCPAFIFNGDFNPVKIAGFDAVRVNPECVNTSGMVTGYAYDVAVAGGAFLWRNGVGLLLNDLIDDLYPGIGPCWRAFVNDHDQILTVKGYGQMCLISPDQDHDGDGLPDDWEFAYGLDPANPYDAFLDPDADGTDNLGEFLLLRNPNFDEDQAFLGGAIPDLRPGIDTDGDGIPNIWEWEHSLDYDDRSDGPLDYDRDGYSNLQEYRLDTDPHGAPAYRIREIGPFPDTSVTSVASLSACVLGSGVNSPETETYAGSNLIESVFFMARPSNTATGGGHRPAAWNVARAAEQGSMAYYPSHGTQACYSVAWSPTGAAIVRTDGNPGVFLHWASPTAAPVPLPGATHGSYSGDLQHYRLSPSGNYLVGFRAPGTNTSGYEPFVWKMPLGTQTYTPTVLVPPPGLSLSPSPQIHVNDAGYVVATGRQGSEDRGILWKIGATGLVESTIVLPAPPGGSFSQVIGISNDENPVIAGDSAIASGQRRATVWSVSGAVTELGAIGVTWSGANLLSPSGLVGGLAGLHIDAEVKYQPFIARRTTDSTTSQTTWRLDLQSDPGTNFSLRSLNDAGEMLGYSYHQAPVSAMVRTLWRHGRAWSLDAALPASSGYALAQVTSVNSNGTILAAAYKDNDRFTILLTPDRDTDGDGLPDSFENQHGFNSYVINSPTDDSDSDGLADLDEYRHATNPRNPDSDGDGMPDGWEFSWGLLPLDPTDAALDPDNDRVTNLRESQIATAPVGVYKVEARLTDTFGIGPFVVAADDSGQVVHTGLCPSFGDTDGNGLSWEESSQEYFALLPLDKDPSATPIPLPARHYYESHNSDWSDFSRFSEYPVYHPDPATGRINADLDRDSYDSVSGWTEQTYFLIPDVVNRPDERDWIPWADVENKLRDPGLHGGSSPLAEYDSLYPWPDTVSPAGTRRLHRSACGECFILDESGGFIGKIADTDWWQMINDRGVAARTEAVSIPAANGLPAYLEYWIVLSTGETIPIPAEPGITTSYSIQAFSNDGKVLLSASACNHQSVWSTRHCLFDTELGTLTRVRQPGLGCGSVGFLSAQNGRLLGTGPEPFLTTPDGTCVRLDALQVRNSPADAPAPFGTLYPRPFYAKHIASDGTITLTTSDAQNRTLILNLVPHNDCDHDGLPDDWETKMLKDAELAYGLGSPTYQRIRAAITSNTFTADSDLDGDGHTARQELERESSDVDAGDSFPTQPGMPENWDNLIANGSIRYRDWSEQSGKGQAFPEFALEGAPANHKPAYYLTRTYTHSRSVAYQNADCNYSWHFDSATNNVTHYDYRTGGKPYDFSTTENWTLNGQTGGSSYRDSSELAEPDHDSHGINAVDEDDWPGAFDSIRTNHTPWTTDSATLKRFSDTGQYAGSDGQQISGDWSSTAAESLTDEYTTAVLMAFVEERLQDSIATTLSECSAGEPESYLTGLRRAVEAYRLLDPAETDYRASICDYVLEASLPADAFAGRGEHVVGWYEASCGADSQWTLKYKHEVLNSQNTEEDVSGFRRYRRPKLRLEGPADTGRRAVCGVGAWLSVSSPEAVEVNGEAGADEGTGVPPTSNDQQLALLSVTLSLDSNMAEFLGSRGLSDFGADLKLTAVTGSDCVRILRRADPDDPACDELAVVTLPLSMPAGDEEWRHLYIEGVKPGYAKLGLSYNAPSGLRLSSLRTITVVPNVEPTTFLYVNDSDGDGDGIPAFADDLADKFNDATDRNVTNDSYDDVRRFGSQAQRFFSQSFYIDEWYDPSVFTEQATISFDYPASDPSEMALTAAPDAVGSRVPPVSNKLRLWNYFGHPAGKRSVKGLDAGGNYVKPRVAYLISEQGYDFILEALQASTSINDVVVKVTIDPDGPGAEPERHKDFKFTAIGMSVHEIMPDESLQRRLSPPVSYPAPRIEERAYPTVDGIRYVATRSQVVANLQLPFVVTSDALNVRDADDLREPVAYACVNGHLLLDEDGKALRLPLSLNLKPGQSLRRPYDRSWDGLLDVTSHPVHVGANDLDLLVIDRTHGFRAKLSHRLDIVAIPGPGSEPADDTFAGYSFTSPPTSGADILTAGGGDYRPYTIRLDMPAEIAQASGALSLFGVDSSWYDPSRHSLPIARHCGAYFMGTHSACGGPVVLIDVPKLLPGASAPNPGPPAPASDEFNGLDPDSDRELGDLQAARAALDVNRDGDVNEADVQADLERLAATFDSDRKDLLFYAGFMKGFVGNPVDALKDTVGLAKAAKGAAEWAVDWAMRHPVEATMYLVFPHALEMRLGREVVLAGSASAHKLEQWCHEHEPQLQKLALFCYNLGNSTDEQIMGFLLTGELPPGCTTVDEIPEEWRVIIDAMAIVYASARDNWLELAPQNRGYVFGYIAFEVAATTAGVILTAVTEGAAAPVLAAKLASTLRVIHGVLSKLRVVDRLMGPLDEILTKLAPVVRAACKFDCLVAGTLISTASGMVPVEEIEAGMLVWAWNTETGSDELCRVEAVFSNPPQEVWTLRYDVDGDGASDGSLTGTGGHPVWNQETTAYVHLCGMQAGDILRMRDGRFATVLTVSATHEPQCTFNFSVDRLRNYYAGEHGILTHNTSTCRFWDDVAEVVKDRTNEIHTAIAAGKKPDSGVWHGWNLVANGKKFDEGYTAAKRFVYNDLVEAQRPKGWPEPEHPWPDIPGLRQNEKQMVQSLREYYHSLDPKKGYIKANPCETLGADFMKNKELPAQFDVEIDSVDTELYCPDVVADGLQTQLRRKFKEVTPKKKANRLCIDLTGYPGDAEELLRTVIARNAGNGDATTFEILYKISGAWHQLLPE